MGSPPLVSVVIPTFNSAAFVAQTVEGVLAQTYRNLDIFITDNAKDDATERMMRREFARDPRIHAAWEIRHR